MNRVLLADSYKYSHSSQYPSNMVSMFDYMESRGGTYPATLFFGLQYILKKYFITPITEIEIIEANEYAKRHGVPFDFEGWKYIVKERKGYLPVVIKAVPEGTLVPVKNVLMTIESTDANVPWIAGWLETILMKIWYPTTIATKSYYVKQMLEKYGAPEWAQFAYHNFGDRGSSSVESAAIGGLGHLAAGFMGTDNFNALDAATRFYSESNAAYSVFATEHSTTTSHGKDGEEGFVLKQLRENPDAPIMSFVADSYDVYSFTDTCTHPDGDIRKLVESRPHQTFVLRPDSGHPFEVIERMLLILLDNKVRFNYDGNKRIVFVDYRILWGDGISPAIIENILTMVTTMGYAAENFVFGSGGDLMQNVTRDTQKFAVKCSSITVNEFIVHEYANREIDVYKDPITDPGKKSKKGRLMLYLHKETGEFFTERIGFQTEAAVEMLDTVYENGDLVKEHSLADIRNRS